MGRATAIVALLGVSTFVVATVDAGLFQSRATGQTTMAQNSSTSAPSYAGVIPGSTNPPVVTVPPGSASPAVVTWPGFQMRSDGGSRFFIQVTSDVELKKEMAPEKIILILKRTRIATRNNTYPLDTRFFNTPVSSAYLERRGKDSAMVLILRHSIQPEITKKVAPDGYHFILIDFPVGDYLEEGEKGESGKPSKASLPITSHTDKESSPKQPRMTEQELRALDEEKPPALRGKTRGSFKLSTGKDSKQKSTKANAEGGIKLFK